jgi:hypothetical protein
MIRFWKSSEGADERPQRAWLHFAVALAAVTVITFTLGAGIAFLFKSGTPTDPVERAALETDRLLAAIAAGDSGEGYEKFSFPLRENTEPEAWAKQCTEWQQQFGVLQSKTQTDFSEGASGGVRWVKVSYDAVFEKTPAQVQATYRKAGDNRWLIDGFSIVAKSTGQNAAK